MTDHAERGICAITAPTMIQTYSEWLSHQTTERQTASLEHMAGCIALGEEQRRSPHSDRAAELSQQAADYYRRWPQ